MNRRQWLRTAGLGIGGLSMSGWFPLLADELAADPRRRRHCILLWMNGGPTQTDTFDMKPDHENGGEFQEIETNVPGVRFSEHLPRLAQHADKLAIVRSLSTKEGDHSRGTHLMRTGHPPMGVIRHPSIGAALAKEMGSDVLTLPNYVSIAPYRSFNQEAYGPGYLGPRYSPLVVGETDRGFGAATPGDGEYATLKVSSVQPAQGVTPGQMSQRLELWGRMQQRFLKTHQVAAPAAHQTIYQGAVNLMQSEAATAFHLDIESDDVRDKYGNGLFGQGCLMARRLIEQGVPFVEVSLNGWDTHNNNFEQVATLSEQLDAGWASLMEDLEERGLLEQTTIIWMGEFGRTPQINGQAGRDHFPSAWTSVLAGGGINGGQVYGKTSADGRQIEDGKAGVHELLATLCSAVGVPPETENIANTGRPQKIVDGSPIRDLLS
ncbi:MAG: DUF1501 domain-containing protein [Planctomycetaceae bacterium]|nr:DUF1501 domain-containing protein [Planctomycetaceae bacterium]